MLVKEAKKNNRKHDSDEEDARPELQPASVGMHNRQKIT
jgi:hypothetical protein